MVFNNNLLLGAAGQGGGQGPFDPTLIGNSVWFNGTDSRMDSPAFSAQSDPTCFTFATWVQILDFSISPAGQYLWSAERTGNYAAIGFDTNNKLFAYSNPATFRSDMIFRDIGWYHIICSYKGSANTVRMFVNGVEITNSRTNSLATNPEPVAFSHTQRIGAYYVGATGGDLYEANSYLAQTVFLDGFSFQDGDITVSDFLDTFTFGTNGSQFIPKKDSELATLAGTAGANSYVLDYADSSNLGNDISSKNNDFTLTNMSSANQSSNTPSLTYPLLNPLSAAFSTPLSNGNTTASGSSGNGDDINPGIIIPSTGKWAWKITNTTAAALIYGVRNFSDMKAANYTYTNLYGFYAFNGTLVQGAGPSGSYLPSESGGDIYIIYYDADSRKMWVSKDGTIPNSGNPDAGTNEAFTIPDSGFDLCPTALVGGNTPNSTFDFGLDGVSLDSNATTFKPLTSANLPTPDYQGIDYFDATLYEGNGTGQRVGDFVPFTDAYTVDKSAMFDDGDTRYFQRTPSGSGNRKTFTLSTWFKRSTITGATQYLFHCQNSGNTNLFTVQFNASDQIVAGGEISGGATDKKVTTNRVFKDTSQWYHLVVRVDTPQSTAADRLRIYINGVEQSFASAAYRNTTEDWLWNAASELHTIARGQAGGSAFGTSSDLYLAETVHIDGTSLGPDSFGQLDTSTNRWIPKDVSGLTFGTNGFYLEYEGTFGTSNGAGDDSSGNTNNFTEGGTWATSDQFVDTPSKNFNVFDSGLNAMGTLSEGNTKIVTATNNKAAYTTMNIPSTGKWYWEVDITSYATGGGSYFGLHEYDELNTGSAGVTSTAVIFQNYNGTANVYDSSSTDTTWCNSVSPDSFVSSGDVLQFALDQDAGTLFIGNNNTWFRAGGARDTFANATTVGTVKFPAGISRRFLVGRGGSFAETYALNFGQQANIFSGSSTTFNAAADGYFVYTPPTGYKALNQDNLDDTASKITAWAWIKNRDSTDSHVLIDRVRGVGVEVHTDGTTTTPETTNTNTVQRFFQRGVQIGSDVQVNTANESYVLWQWLVGDSATTGTVNNDGSIASTVIAADAGHFSVVSWTGNETLGATIGHGLGGTPEFIIAIARAESGENKPVYHKFMTSDNDHLKINEANAQGTAGTTIWDVSAMSSTLIGLGAAVQSNSNNGMIAYCFRSVPGVCKVGSYVGNNTDDNAYISLGFKPRFFMCKMITGSSQWHLIDSARSPINEGQIQSFANLTNAEQNSTVGAYDLLSDGIKIRSDAGFEPGNTGTWLYMALADIGGNGTLPPIYGR